MKRAEVLSPVGSIESFYAAINAKCDAIYLSGELYGARKATTKFNMDDIKYIINTSHIYGVKVYITINTLIFDNEINECIKYTDEIYKAGVDAILIQDMGLLNIFSKRYPSLDLHISTQVNTKTYEEIKFYESIPNVKRVVLARETPIEEIKRIKENTNLEIEVFVHGAICMSYSGNCLYSSLIMNRSGNRGECSQPCRLKYSLYENNKLIDDNKYLLSPKELNTIEYIDELLKIGVDSLKIEGRIKSSEYVALTTSLYKEKVLNPNKEITLNDIDNLKRAYNRDFTKGYLFNITPSSLVNNYRPNNMGLYLGKVIENNSSRLKLKLESPLYRLDGIRIITEKLDDYGLTVDKIFKNNKEVEFGKALDIVEIESFKLPKFDCKNKDVYVTSSKILKDELKDLLINKINRSDQPLNLRIELIKDKYPILIDNTRNISIKGDFKVLEASSKPITKDDIFKQLNKLNDTPFFINSIDYSIDDNAFIPIGVLNSLRRELIDTILNNKISDRVINKNTIFDSPQLKINKSLIVKVETYEQFITSYNLGIRDFYIYGIDLYNQIRKEYNSDRIILETPRIIDDYKLYKDINPKLVSDVGSINNNSILDAYLNVTNIYALNYYYNRGANLITLSHELNKDRILEMKSRYKNVFKSEANIALVIYDKVDLMLMKYCLVSGYYKTKPNCNICKNNNYYLKDRNNEKTIILKTPTCGNRLINSKTLCLFEYINELNDAIDVFRINFTIERKDEVERVIKAFLNKKFVDGLDFTRGRFLK